MIVVFFATVTALVATVTVAVVIAAVTVATVTVPIAVFVATAIIVAPTNVNTVAAATVAASSLEVTSNGRLFNVYFAGSLLVVVGNDFGMQQHLMTAVACGGLRQYVAVRLSPLWL